MDNMMRIDQIFLREGRTHEQKHAVIEKAIQSLVDAVGAPEECRRVPVHNVPKEN